MHKHIFTNSLRYTQLILKAIHLTMFTVFSVYVASVLRTVRFREKKPFYTLMRERGSIK